jgi:hypothetical protein
MPIEYYVSYVYDSVTNLLEKDPPTQHGSQK